jgi:hypothetical protein
MASALEENSDNNFVQIMDFPDVETDGSDFLDVGTHGSVNLYSSMFSNMDDKFLDMPPYTEDTFPDEVSYDDMPALVSYDDMPADSDSDSEHPCLEYPFSAPITSQNVNAYFESLRYRLKVKEEKEKGKKRKEREMMEKGKQMNS